MIIENLARRWFHRPASPQPDAPVAEKPKDLFFPDSLRAEADQTARALTQASPGTCLVVTGPPGSGKSSLIQGVAARAHWQLDDLQKDGPSGAVTTFERRVNESIAHHRADPAENGLLLHLDADGARPGQQEWLLARVAQEPPGSHVAVALTSARPPLANVPPTSLHLQVELPRQAERKRFLEDRLGPYVFWPPGQGGSREGGLPAPPYSGLPLDQAAAQTAGWSFNSLEMAVRQAALAAVRNGASELGAEQLQEGLQRVAMGLVGPSPSLAGPV